MIESDVEDYVRWFTVETEWGDWDAPWEPIEEDEASARRRFSSYFSRVSKLNRDAVRRDFEIECDGAHIGSVNFYTDLQYMENPEQHPAVGINIYEPGERSRGAGTEALRQYIAYLHTHGYNTFYTQTWSGNVRMLRVAEKLGFREVCRKKGLREVRGERYDALTLRLDL